MSEVITKIKQVKNCFTDSTDKVDFDKRRSLNTEPRHFPSLAVSLLEGPKRALRLNAICCAIYLKNNRNQIR